MELFPLFFRIRAITFTIIMLFSFLWLVLLSVETFARWSTSDQITHSLLILFLLTNATTLILLPILLLVRFRVWLDAARLLLLLVLQVGSAAAGTYWSPKIQCPHQTPDDIGVCQLIGIYTLIACWIIPTLLVLHSTYFAVVIYLQPRIPVVVDSEHRLSTDPEMGSTDSLSSWREMLKEVVGVQRSSVTTSVQSRSLVSPTMVHTGESSPLQSTSLNPPRQSTMPALPGTSQQHLSTSYSMPIRHRSLPAFKHGDEPHIRPVLTLPIPHSLATSASSSYPQTPSSYSHSAPSSSRPLNQSFALGPSMVDAVQSPSDHRWRSKHLSMMPSSSPLREMQSARESPTTRSTRAKLSKPLPAYLL